MKKGNFIVAAVAGCVLALTGCGKSVQVEEQTGQTSQNISVAENNSKANVESSSTQQKGVNGGLAFSTEYTVEEYCHGRYIVSKSGGRLYGMLDGTGKEIIPVKYDSLEFMNESDLENGKDTTLYLKAKCEDKYYVFDENGKQILDKDANYQTYALGVHTETSYVFCYNDTDEYKLTFYNRRGEVCWETNYNNFEDVINYYYNEQLTATVKAISENNYYVLSEYSTIDNNYQRKTYNKLYLYDKNGNVIKKWDISGSMYIPSGVVNNTFVFSVGTVKTIQQCPVYVIDKQGNVKENTDYQWIGTVLTKNDRGSAKIANSLEMPFININLCYN